LKQSVKKLAVKEQKPEEQLESLFIRLGGDLVVKDIADKFVNYIFGDPLLKPFFLNKTSLHVQKRLVGNFLKTYFGSPRMYLGKLKLEEKKKCLCACVLCR